MTVRTVVVTGGARGIGLACARAFHADGHRVAVLYRSKPVDDLFSVQCDVTDPAAVDAAFTAVEDELGPAEVVVSNAGVTRDTLLVRMGDDDWADAIGTNLTGAFHVARRALRPMMRARWGRVVFMSSVAAHIGVPGQANYAAAKAGLIGLARSIAREYATRGITANLVAPGPVTTEMTTVLGAQRVEELADAVPVKRFGTPDEVAAAVRFLASDEAAFITGAILPVDGGLGMGH